MTKPKRIKPKDAADTGAVLLFDESDAPFAKRTEVRDASDRYANIEISYRDPAPTTKPK